MQKNKKQIGKNLKMWINISTWAILVIPALLVFSLYVLQDSMILFPSKSTFSQIQKTTKYTTEKIFLSDSYSGILSKNHPSPNGLLVFIHGNAGSVNDRQYILDFFVSLGYKTILLEYPGFGERSGKAQIQEIIFQTEKDLLSIEKQMGSFTLVGESFGAGIVARHASKTKTKNIFLVTPWDSLESVVSGKMPGAQYLLKDKMNSINSLKNYNGNVFIIGASHDEVIPIHHAKTLFESLKKEKTKFTLLENSGHNDWISVIKKNQQENLFSLKK